VYPLALILSPTRELSMQVSLFIDGFHYMLIFIIIRFKILLNISDTRGS
jgi:superfamily II DNA/RNA helicase